MTSATVILALFPAALGAGAETNQPLAIAVIGGMISSTLPTLVVVPAVYSLVENRLTRSARWKKISGCGIPPHPATPGLAQRKIPPHVVCLCRLRNSSPLRRPSPHPRCWRRGWYYCWQSPG